MIRIRSTRAIALWTLQWSLALGILVTGMLDVGLSAERPARGLLLAVAAVALVVPSASRFFPALSPLAASALAFALATGATTPADLVLALGCVGVAIARGFITPVEPVDLRAEQVDPLARPGDQAGVRRGAEPPPRRAGHPERVRARTQNLAHL